MEGILAEPTQELVLEGLQRAAAEPDGLPLLTGKTAPGLFAASATGKRAGQFCLDQGWLKTLRTERRGKTSVAYVGVTDAGLQHLLEEAHPRKVLTSFIEAVEARRSQLHQVLDLVRTQQAALTELGQRVGG